MGSHPLIVMVGVVLDVSVLSVEAARCHSANIVGMRETLDHFVPEVSSVVRIESPLKHLVA